MAQRILDATDLFSGGGGASEGLKQAGWWLACAANHDPVSVATHKLNHPDTDHRLKDLKEVDWRTFPSTTALWVSPSCVWHARSGGRKQLPEEVELLRADEGSIDRATAFAVIEAAEVHRYPVIFIENVPEFMAWVLYPLWLEMLRTLGYHVEVLMLDAADFGHAQIRKRMFMVATFDGLRLDLSMENLTKGVQPVYAADILDPDPGKPLTRELYISPQIAEIREEYVPHLVVYRRHAHALRASSNRLATITAGGNHHAVAQIRDGVRYQRIITDRECALAQGFPEHYQFVGSPKARKGAATDKVVKKQIGNAVAVGIARRLGAIAAEALA
jgi:DNA (cytosine-5)-methyltransferase 1